MTIEQFHLEFKVAFDKVDSSAYPEFESGEIDIYLNEAQDRFVKQRYGYNNIYGVGFEQIQKRTEDLKEIVKSRYTALEKVDSYEEMGMNVYKADIYDLYQDKGLTTASTDEYMFFIKALANSCSDTCCVFSKVKLVQQDDIATIIADPFNKPKLNKPIIFFEDGSIYIWTVEGATVDGFYVTFIKRPAKMNLGTYGGTKTECELSEHTHKEIVQMAVGIALENIESPRQQTQEVLNVKKVE